MVIAISGFGIGFRSPEHRVVSHGGTRTVDDEVGEAGKFKERRLVRKAEAEFGLTRVRTD